MAKFLTPRLLLRGFEIFAAVSLAGFVATLIYGGNVPAFFQAIGRLHWGWVLAGLALAACDWLGGGLRLWVVARVLQPNPSLRGMVLAGGMSAWAAYLTPFNSGAGPMMLYTMRRYGTPLPVAITCLLMSFVGTVGFFAIAGPAAILAGAGKSLGAHGVVLGISLYDLFLGSLAIFAGLGVLLVLLMIFPRLAIRAITGIGSRFGRNRPKVRARLMRLRHTLEQAHDSLARFNNPRGWLAAVLCTIISGPSHANKLLAGYVALRAIGITPNFVDVLLLQTLVTFLLYFAPTPGGSGVAEVTSAAVMSIYVPRELLPIYTLIWRMILSYYTLAAGFLIFSHWVRKGLKGIAVDEEGAVSGDPVAEAGAPG